MKKITLRINDNLLEMIEELKETEGYTQTTQVILDAVRFKHRTFFQTRIKKTATVDVELNKKNREQKLIEQKSEIIEKLGGKLNDAKTHCIYYTYDYKVKNEQEIPLELITEELLETQFFPSREKCLGK